MRHFYIYYFYSIFFHMNSLTLMITTIDNIYRKHANVAVIFPNINYLILKTILSHSVAG